MAQIINGPYRCFRDLNPDETFIEYEGSTITIPISVKLPNGEWESERLKLEAFMRLEVFPAYLNGLGTREFQFIIRDWELFGYSSLLNKVFMGDKRGYLEPGMSQEKGREQATMTFSLSHHYIKYGDDNNRNFATAKELEIDNITHHDTINGDIYWYIDKGSKGKYNVIFHHKLPEENGKIKFDKKNDAEYIVCEAQDVEPGESFTAKKRKGLNTVFSKGNTVLKPGLQLQYPLSISWRLGENPEVGKFGKIHEVSPAKSLCVADQGPKIGAPEDSADFPARISYSASYDIFINDQIFVKDQAGVAIAVGVDRIPPVDVLVAFEKPYEGRVMNTDLIMRSGTCTGMIEILSPIFYRGVKMARHARTARLDVQKGSRPELPDFL